MIVAAATGEPVAALLAAAPELAGAVTREALDTLLDPAGALVDRELRRYRTWPKDSDLPAG